MFLARLVTELLPAEPEALGLLALMLHAKPAATLGAIGMAITCRLPSRILRFGTRR